jgi:hypothetical protein
MNIRSLKYFINNRIILILSGVILLCMITQLMPIFSAAAAPALASTEQWAWGNNFNGQLGDGTNIDSNIPVQVHGLTNAIGINASGNQGYVLVKKESTPALTKSTSAPVISSTSSPISTSSSPITTTSLDHSLTTSTTYSSVTVTTSSILTMEVPDEKRISYW